MKFSGSIRPCIEIVTRDFCKEGSSQQSRQKVRETSGISQLKSRILRDGFPGYSSLILGKEQKYWTADK